MPRAVAGAMRHHFASRLVQRGLRQSKTGDLSGHSTVQMSLRYAHLAPDRRREAVAKLDEKSIIALTLRLPWTAFPVDGLNYLSRTEQSCSRKSPAVLRTSTC